MTTKLKWQRHAAKKVTWTAKPAKRTRYKIVRVILSRKRDLYGERTWYHVYVNGVMLDSENHLAPAKATALKDFEYRKENGLA